MCQGKNICSELGRDPSLWSKTSPLPTPSWMSQQFDLFLSAVDEFLSGDREKCINKLKEIKDSKITNWYIEHGQMSGRHRRIILNTELPKLISENLRDRIRSPRKIQNIVFERDGYKCRYCGNRLISQEFIKLFIKKLNSPVFQKGGTNLTTHSIIHISWPVADHVIPWNQGGRTDLDNLVSACATCNYGKDGNTLEQIGIDNPFDREPIKDNWLGLTEKLELLKNVSL